MLSEFHAISGTLNGGSLDLPALRTYRGVNIVADPENESALELMHVSNHANSYKLYPGREIFVPVGAGDISLSGTGNWSALIS